MSESDPKLTRDQLLDLVADGQRALGQGRTEEALLVAESALEDDAELVPALALKGDALEKQGRIDEALACYEQVLDLKPDSALDRIRANQLRKLLDTEDEEVVVETSRRGAVLAAVLAGVVLVCAATALFLASQGRASADVAQADDPGVVEAFTPPTPVPSPSNPAAFTEQQPQPGAVATNQGSSETGYVGSSRGTGSSSVAAPPTGQYPAAQSSVPPFNPGVVVMPDPQTTITGTAPAPGAETTGGTGGTTTGTTGNPDPPPVKKEEEKKEERDPGIIDIRPSKGSASSGTDLPGGSEVIKDDAEAKKAAETLIRVARRHFVGGKFALAADAYTKALRYGASPGSTNQRLAQCYERLKKKREASMAYRRAIDGYRKADPVKYRANIAACEKALRLLSR